MGIMVEPAKRGHRRRQRVLAAMAERRVAEVVGQRARLGQILIDPERASERSRDLRDFEAVGQADAKMIAVGANEHLRLVPQPAEGAGVDDAVAVALKRIARHRRRLGVEPPARGGGIGGERSDHATLSRPARLLS